MFRLPLQYKCDFGLHGFIGSSSFVWAVRTCAEREPSVTGKSNSIIRQWLLNEGTIVPARTLMIGDRGLQLRVPSAASRHKHTQVKREVWNNSYDL